MHPFIPTRQGVYGGEDGTLYSTLYLPGLAVVLWAADRIGVCPFRLAALRALMSLTVWQTELLSCIHGTAESLVWACGIRGWQRRTCVLLWG